MPWFGSYLPHSHLRCKRTRPIYPSDKKCVWCLEGFKETDRGTINDAGQALHLECEIRMVVGSAAHQTGNCSCFGGTHEDPPDASPREAAKLALAMHELRQNLNLEPLNFSS
jgi:hypothetical protein